MKLGLLTAAFRELTLEQVAEWAAPNGFDVLEVACWPAAGGERGATPASPTSTSSGSTSARCTRRWSARPRDLVARLLPEQPAPRRRDRGEAHAHLRRVIDAAQALGVEIVGTFVGDDKDRRCRRTSRASARSGRALVALRRRART